MASGKSNRAREIVTGIVTLSEIPSGSNSEQTIYFGYTFKQTPKVVANVKGPFTADEVSHINIVDVGASYFRVRLKNLYTTPLTPKIIFIAIA